MNLREHAKSLFWIITLFAVCYYLPVGTPRFDGAVKESLELVRWYAREHVLLCLVPAFFIAGAIGVFIRQDAVMKYLGAKANKVLAYGVASVSGSILAVCSCTVLPLFSGIYKRGAGLGPATAFLYSGPAINVIAMILTMRVLGIELGLARIIGAVTFSIVIGLLMHFIFRKEEIVRADSHFAKSVKTGEEHSLAETFALFLSMSAILVFANWGEAKGGAWIWTLVYSWKWILTSVFALIFGVLLIKTIRLAWWKVSLAALAVIVTALIWGSQTPLAPFGVATVALILLTSTDSGKGGEWFAATWDFAKLILPLLLGGVLVAGFLLGGPHGGEGIIPSSWIVSWVGGNSILSNFVASFLGAFMYFATLTEIPILQGLMGSGMGKGPALALLLAGPALSLPSMLVINSVLKPRKTATYVLLVIVMATITGLFYGYFF
jgi:uncharacterized membrane protein YraQ (UPF0718 family)